MGELQDRLNNVEKTLNELRQYEKEKKFNLPFFSRVRNKQQKKGIVLVLKINENGAITPEKHKVDEQTIMVDGVPRVITAESVLRWKAGLFKNYPVVILPSWSTEPFYPQKSLEESVKNGTNIKGIKLILNRMKLSAVDSLKKSIPPWIFIAIGLIVVVGGGYLLFTGKI